MKKFQPTYAVKRKRALYDLPGDGPVLVASGLTLDAACLKVEDTRDWHRNVYIEVDPYTWPQFLRIKLRELLDIPSEASLWANYRLDGEPMNTVDFANSVEWWGLDMTNDSNRDYSRTEIGWCLYGFVQWITSWNKRPYETTASEQACDYFVDWKLRPFG